MPTPEGYNHIALFSPVDSSTPRFLTAGDWEVTDGILGVDPLQGLMCVILLPRCDDQTDRLFEIPRQLLHGCESNVHRTQHLLHTRADRHGFCGGQASHPIDRHLGGFILFRELLSRCRVLFVELPRPERAVPEAD